jgi:hypothetical protein
MLIEGRLHQGIRDGRITVLFRRWRRPQVVAGHTYRTAAGLITVDAIDVVTDRITKADARRAGYPDPESVFAELEAASSPTARMKRRYPPKNPDGELTTYRLKIRYLDIPDPRDELAHSADLADTERAEITKRLDRLDKASPFGPWTRPTLAKIAERPATRAADLASDFGRETAPFKLDVRKLKNMGLTISLEVGYRLSPRGESYLKGGA